MGTGGLDSSKRGGEACIWGASREKAGKRTHSLHRDRLLILGCGEKRKAEPVQALLGPGR